MTTVGTRDLKQNPQAVLRRVLASGEPVEVTSHGHPTGVALVPLATGPRPWVRGAELAAITPLTDDAAQRLHDDLAAVDHDDAPADPWAAGA